MMKVKVRSSHGVSHPAPAKIVSITDAASIRNCAVSITLRRSKLSASAPDTTENSMIGSAVEA
jgi:hypothetical protein